jgi:uncharacterized protein (DUF2147 family)
MSMRSYEPLRPLLPRTAYVAIFIAGICFFAFVATTTFAADPRGVWMVEKEAALEIFDCKGLLCGRVVFLKTPRDTAGELKREQQNPDAALRPRLICGMTVLEDLRPAGPDNWEGGRFYDPRDGGRYSIMMRLISADVMLARIYINEPSNGKSETLLRVRRLNAEGWC